MNEAAFRAAERRYWDRLGLQPEERWFTLASGARVRAQVIGDGPPALVLHGINNAGVMVAGLAALVRKRRCYVLDRPGCGLSTLPLVPVRDQRDFVAFVDALVPEVLDALEVESATMVSTSMGGLFALRAAATVSQRVDAVVHVGWSMGAPLRKLPLVMRPANTRTGAWLMATVPVPRVAVKPMLESIGLKGAFAKGNVPDELVDAMYALVKHTDTMRNEVRLGPTVLDRMDDVVIAEDLLARVTAPTLLLWGTDDPMGGIDIAQAFAAKIPTARLEPIAGAGHAPWLDEPEFVDRQVTAFLPS